MPSSYEEEIVLQTKSAGQFPLGYLEQASTSDSGNPNKSYAALYLDTLESLYKVNLVVLDSLPKFRWKIIHRVFLIPYKSH